MYGLTVKLTVIRSHSVQAFILPGSMYISILFGAAYGVLIGVLLSCIVSLLSSSYSTHT
jgi:uncharacterized membrane protein YdjX (TVP38/TMEM64 family)